MAYYFYSFPLVVSASVMLAIPTIFVLLDLGINLYNRSLTEVFELIRSAFVEDPIDRIPN